MSKFGFPRRIYSVKSYLYYSENHLQILWSLGQNLTNFWPTNLKFHNPNNNIDRVRKQKESHRTEKNAPKVEQESGRYTLEN